MQFPKTHFQKIINTNGIIDIKIKQHVKELKWFDEMYFIAIELHEKYDRKGQKVSVAMTDIDCLAFAKHLRNVITGHDQSLYGQYSIYRDSSKSQNSSSNSLKKISITPYQRDGAKSKTFYLNGIEREGQQEINKVSLSFDGPKVLAMADVFEFIGKKTMTLNYEHKTSIDLDANFKNNNQQQYEGPHSGGVSREDIASVGNITGDAPPFMP